MNCENLLKKHPDVVLHNLEELHTYKIIDNGLVVEQWEKDENGVWIDKTPEVLEEQEIKRQIAELEKRLRYVK